MNILGFIKTKLTKSQMKRAVKKEIQDFEGGLRQSGFRFSIPVDDTGKIYKGEKNAL